MREFRSRRCNLTRWALIASSVTIPGLLEHAAAQVVQPPVDTFVQVTGPANAYPTEHISFCFAVVRFNYKSIDSPVDVGHSLAKELPGRAVLRILDAKTGDEKAKKEIMLAVPGSPALPPDPCVEYVIPAVSVTTSIFSSAPPPTSPALYIGVVSVSSQPLAPGVAPVSSLDIFASVSGIPTNVRHVVPSATCPPGSIDYPCVF